jgi:hypothetical protein
MSGIFSGSTNGVLGAPMAVGPGYSYQDGSLGAPMAIGPGYSYQDGSLGAPMAIGPGSAYQDGSLGCATCGLRGLGSSFRGLGETSVAVPTTLILGAMIGAAAMYWLQGEKKTA